MHTLRARFKKDIVVEFLPSSAILRGKREKKSKVIILCSGLPGVPSQRAILEFFSKEGFWVITPRYRGTWESGGKFLKISPHQDILDIVSELPKGIVSLWDGKRYRLKPKMIYLFASSFGGPAAILASRDPRITKVVAFSPVVDWRAPSTAEPIDKLARFMKVGFGEAYRPAKDAFKKLKSGKFYNPIAVADKIDGRKLFIIHAKDDELVSASSVKRFVRKCNPEFLLLNKGSHFSLRNFTEPKFYKRIRSFLAKN